jgi:hypothetical protein
LLIRESLALLKRKAFCVRFLSVLPPTEDRP